MKRQLKRRSKTSDSVKGAIDSIGQREKEEPVEFLGSGSTTLNLALSGKGKGGGWARARVVNVVGDGSSGKTLLALEVAFWCYKNIKKIKSEIFPKVKKIHIVYLNAEGSMDFPIKRMYGKGFVNAVKWLANKPIENVGRNYIRKLNNLKKGEFLLFIIDSWDALQSFKDHDRFAESALKDVEMKDGYNLEKQRYTSKFFGYVCSLLEKNSKDSTLFIVSQVRKKIGVKFGKKTYRAGGDALNFYTHQVVWIREVEKLTKTKKKEKRVYGIRSHAKIERSKVAKPFRESDFSILYNYGLDDLGSMVDYLWGKKIIKFHGREFKTKRQFIKYVENNGLEDEVIKKTEEKWQNIESSFDKEVSTRKKRY